MIHVDDDDFDWEAAVAEIENAEKSGLLQSKVSTEHAKAPRQKSIQSYFGGQGNVQPPPLQAPQFYRQEQNDTGTTSEYSRVSIDPAAAKAWIYPANVPRRDYQFSITKTALFANTLVSLPTGLGKTLIAAVVIYNFYRWFPEGKIVFTAPSRPLVIQQIEACHNTVGIPQDLTIDMTGQISPTQRADLWITKRVFFVTPQVLEKDIKSGICPLQNMVCLVVDEAHRATGNYAYCVAVREIMASNISLRILALTATPGSNQATIQDVVDNLNISCLEYRNEDDPDVCQYTHTRKLELIQVTMNAESNSLKDMFVEVLQPIVSKLSSFRVFYHTKEVLRLTTYEFLQAREKFRQAPPAGLAQVHYAEVETCFGLAITLTHILKLLFSHGIKPAFEMLRSKLQQGLLAKIMGKSDKMHQIKMLMQQSISHGAPSPKLAKMEEILLEHFHAHDPGSTRVIIFTNYRDSVKDIMEWLAKLNGIVNAMEFIGQSAGTGKSLKGQTQKVQQAVLQKFRNGGYNTIVATSIGEEGLDIMEVDLVICFDANISPLRMIQRMGRTGRKRDGRVVVLASEGAETQGYLSKQAKGRAVGKHMRNGGISSFSFHPSSRMVPHAYKPEVQVLELTIEQFVPRGRKNKSEAQTPLLPGITNLTDEEVSILDKYYRSTEQPWRPSLLAFPHYQLFPTPVQNVKHSSRTTGLIHVLQGLRGLPPLQADIADILQKPEDGLQNQNTPGDGYQNQDTPEVADEEVDSEPGSPFVLSAPIRDYTHSGPSSPANFEDNFFEGIPSNSPRSPVADIQGNVFDSVNNFPRSPVADMADTRSPIPVAGSPRLPDSLMAMDFEIGSGKNVLAAPSNHVCLFSTGVVSVSESGHVVISSPPVLRRRQIPEQCTPEPEVPICDSGDEIIMETPELAKNRRQPVGADEVPASRTPCGAHRDLSSSFKEEQSSEKDKAEEIPMEQVPGTPMTVTPAQQNASSDWQCHTSSTVKKPRPLKRLRRGKKPSPLEITKKVKPGKHQRMQLAQQFIDDEAEVSTDEEVSADTEEDGEASQSFIDDHAQTQPQSSVDMLAVYRKSLLTPSPNDLAPWMRFLPPNRTPGSSDPGISSTETPSRDHSSSFDRSVAALGSGLKSVSITRQPPSIVPETTATEGPTDPVIPTLDMRKRKLSFQPGAPTHDQHMEAVQDECNDDDLFDGLDLDALEAEAAQKCRERKEAGSSQKPIDDDLHTPPSFDLGI